jgi:hypothetical protein
MPGSLGIEAIIQGLWAYAKYFQKDTNFHNPLIDFSFNEPLYWKYRGQVIPANREIKFEILLKTKYISDSSIKLAGDADFWVDDVRIYTIQNISMKLSEG